MRARRWLLWGAAAVTVPVPFFLAQTGLVPAARLAMLSGVVSAVVISGNGGGVVTMMAVLLAVQCALALAACWALAAWITRFLDRLGRRAATAATVLLAAAALVAALWWPLYHDPFAVRELHPTLRSVYE